jgi:hypothetical protein
LGNGLAFYSNIINEKDDEIGLERFKNDDKLFEKVGFVDDFQNSLLSNLTFQHNICFYYFSAEIYVY